MSHRSAETILDHVWLTVGAMSFRDLSDDALLRHVTLGREREAQAAFAVLVQRHGPLVYRTCWGMLRNAHDAEDAFQATFLVLTRKARSLQSNPCIGPWLYEVARRISLHARAAAERRRRHERQAAIPETVSIPMDRREDLSQLHDVLDRLPSRWRTPIVLCDLEGLTYQAAAAKLGWSMPTFRNRLARARQSLRAALQRRGVAPASAFAAHGAVPAVPLSLLNLTVRGFAPTATGVAAGAASASIIALTNQGLQSMLLIKLKTVGLAFIAASVLVAGAVGISGQTQSDKSKPNDPPKPSAAEVAAAPPSKARGTTAALVAKLNGPAEIEKPLDGVILKDVLDFLSDKYDVTFVFDHQGFERIGKKTADEEQVRIGKMRDVSLDTILRHVLGQVNGAFLVRHNHLEITSSDKAILESRNGVLLSLQSDLQPLVNIVCNSESLEKVLADLARQSGRNLVLDSRVKDREQLKVTVTLLNTPIETAARVIADLSKLQTVSMDNVIYVTTPDHAAELMADDQAAAERRKATIAEQTPRPAKP